MSPTDKASNSAAQLDGSGAASSGNGAAPPSARYDDAPPAGISSANRAERQPSRQPSNASPRRSGAHGDEPPYGLDRNPRPEEQPIYREKLVPTSKIYVGGLPSDTLEMDLKACFGTCGRIVATELKAGFGFVEFEHKYEADKAVETYHNGQFMGSQIKVEHSKGGGRTAKFLSEPGHCFKCGLSGHWAKECPNTVIPVEGSQSPSARRNSSTYRDTSQPARSGPPPSDPYRDAPAPARSDRSESIASGAGYRDAYGGYRGSQRAPSPPLASNDRGRGYGPPPSSGRAPSDSYNDRGGPPSAGFPAPGPPRDYGLPPAARDDRFHEGPPPSLTGSRDYYPPAALPPPAASRYDDRRDFRGPPPPPASSARGGYSDDRDRLPPATSSYREDRPRRDFHSSGPPPLPPVSGGGPGYGYGAPPPPPPAPAPRVEDFYNDPPPPPPRIYGGGPDIAPYGREPDRFAGRAPLGGRPVSPPIGRYGAPGGDRDAPGGGATVFSGWTERSTRRAPSPSRGRSDYDAARYGAPPAPAPYESDLYAPVNNNSARRRSQSPSRRYDSGAPGSGGQGGGYDSRGYNGNGGGGGGGYGGGRGVANGARY